MIELSRSLDCIIGVTSLLPMLENFFFNITFIVEGIELEEKVTFGASEFCRSPKVTDRNAGFDSGSEVNLLTFRMWQRISTEILQTKLKACFRSSQTIYLDIRGGFSFRQSW